jgi:hypothetical protein
MIYRMFAASLFAAALVVLGQGTPAVADDKKDAVHEGHVVKVADGKLTMVGADKKEATHAVAKDAKITLDGKEAKLDDLKEHTVVKVTMKVEGEKHTITKIEAETKK